MTSSLLAYHRGSGKSVLGRMLSVVDGSVSGYVLAI